MVPLYAGRWYHIAAVLTHAYGVGENQWSTLELYVNGRRIGQCSCALTYAMDSTSAVLYLGWDQLSGSSSGKFKGLIDEFRLYKTSLSQDSVRGLMWFLKGSNSLIVPRGVFYDSLLFKQMSNASSADIMNGPLAGANVHANSNNLSSNLNSRVIQMVIDKNLTLADAYRLLGLLWTNKTGNVTAFAFFATSEFHTLGFAWEVSKLVANTSVASSGNYTAPPIPPPRPWWDTVWNTIAGVFQYIWNAVVAVYTFFGNVAKWLADAFIGLTIGLATGNWTYFENNVVQPFKKALDALIQFLVNLVTATIKALVDGVLKPVLAPLQTAVSRIVSGLKQALNIDPPVATTLVSLTLAALPIIIVAGTIIVLIMIGVGMAIQSFPIAGLIIAALLVSVLFAIFLSMIPKEPKAANPQDEYHFLAQFDENFGSAVFLAGLIDYSMGKVLAVAAVGGNLDASGVLELLLTIIFSMITFFVDGVAIGLEHTRGACFVGILGLTLSGLSLSLATASLVKRPSLGGIGLVVSYYALAITLFGLALVSFASDSGYVLNNCG
jgi:hypothetical protein